MTEKFYYFRFFFKPIAKISSIQNTYFCISFIVTKKMQKLRKFQSNFDNLVNNFIAQKEKKLEQGVG
jgi:hypothetical protein